MNRKTLQKVIDAIKENKIEYAMGILDTLMETLPAEATAIRGTNSMLPNTAPVVAVPITDQPMDEGKLMDLQTLEMIKKLNSHPQNL